MRMRRPGEQQRRTVIELVALTILAWATQTLVSQWGFGAEAAEERFVPSAFSRAAGVEFLSEAAVGGAEVRLKDIARWTAADEPAMREAGELVVTRINGDGGTVDVQDVKQMLGDAGINLSVMTFSGAMSCRVSRRAAGEVAEVGVLAASAAAEAASVGMLSEMRTAAAVGAMPARTLKEVITQELAAHLRVPVETLQVRFDAKDEKTVNLSEPQHRFAVEPQRQRRLGNLTWDVTVTSALGKRRVSVVTHVQAWQTQLVAARPLSMKQVIQEEDLAERRVLADHLDEEPVSRAAIVGQQAGREIPIGTALTPRLIQSVQLVRLGQLITVVVEQGRVHVKWVAEARENGNYGQVIRVRKPGTREEFFVVVSGPEQARLTGSGGEGVAVGR